MLNSAGVKHPEAVPSEFECHMFTYLSQIQKARATISSGICIPCAYRTLRVSVHGEDTKLHQDNTLHCEKLSVVTSFIQVTQFEFDKYIWKISILSHKRACIQLCGTVMHYVACDLHRPVLLVTNMATAFVCFLISVCSSLAKILLL